LEEAKQVIDSQVAAARDSNRGGQGY